MNDKWLRNRESYDWGKEEEHMLNGEPLDMTYEEFKDYLRWLSVYDRESFDRLYDLFAVIHEGMQSCLSSQKDACDSDSD